MATTTAIGYRKRETLPTVIKEGTKNELHVWGKPDSTSSSCNQRFGVRFRETSLGDKYPVVYGPHLIIVENLRGHLATINKEEWRQVPTQKAFIELSRAESAQHRRHQHWKKSEEKRVRLEVRAAETKARPERRLAEKKARLEKRILHGGLTQIFCPTYNNGGHGAFKLEEIKPYTDLRFDARVQSRESKDGVRTVSMRRRLTSDIVGRFYSLWRDASGYRNPNGSLRKLIVPIKEKIIVWLLAEAKSKGWRHGVKAERWSQANILYIDTPDGQVSFHRPPEEFSLPLYVGEWSGIRNSDLIIRKLLGEDVCTTPKMETPALPVAIDAVRETTA